MAKSEYKIQDRPRDGLLSSHIFPQFHRFECSQRHHFSHHWSWKKKFSLAKKAEGRRLPGWVRQGHQWFLRPSQAVEPIGPEDNEASQIIRHSIGGLVKGVHAALSHLHGPLYLPWTLGIPFLNPSNGARLLAAPGPELSRTP